MLNYATRLPPGKPVELLANGRVRKTNETSLKKFFNSCQELIINQMLKPEPWIVPVYQFDIIKIYEPLYGCPSYKYYYDMMRCGLLSLEERTFVNFVGDLWDRHSVLTFKYAKDELSEYKEKHPKLFNFLQFVVEETKYADLHSGNVMINEEEEYCLIDLEGFRM